MQLSKLSLVLGLAATAIAVSQSSSLSQVPDVQSQNPQSPVSGSTQMGVTGSGAYPVSGAMTGSNPKNLAADDDYMLSNQMSALGPIPDSQIQLSGTPSGSGGFAPGIDEYSDLDAAAIGEMYGIPMSYTGAGYPPNSSPLEVPMELAPADGLKPGPGGAPGGVPKPIGTTTSATGAVPTGAVPTGVVPTGVVPSVPTTAPPKPSHVYEGASDLRKVGKGTLCVGVLFATFAVLMS